jgi:hypothetical protein
MKKLIIACAGSKQREGGYFRDSEGRRIKFVAQPHLAPDGNNVRFGHPDDSSNGKTWRELVDEYNATYRANSNHNPYGLFPAYQLYTPKGQWSSIYRNLVNSFGKENVFILSAGWGLIASDFLTPQYDITFSKNSKIEPYKKRAQRDDSRDFCQLQAGPEDELFLFAGTEYTQIFHRLTKQMPVMRKHIYTYDSMRTQNKYTWYYQYAADFIKHKGKSP